MVKGLHHKLAPTFEEKNMNQKQAKELAQDMLHDFWLTYTEHGENYMEKCKNDKEREKVTQEILKLLTR